MEDIKDVLKKSIEEISKYTNHLYEKQESSDKEIKTLILRLDEVIDDYKIAYFEAKPLF